MNYEPKDASLRLIALSAGFLAFLVAASIGTSTLYYRGQYRGVRAVPTAGRTTSFTHGSDQPSGIAKDYAQVTETAKEHLEGYGWMDQKAGIARIPIRRAMDLVGSGVKPPPPPKEPGQVP